MDIIPSPNTPNGEYKDYNPITREKGTAVTKDMLLHPQQEIVNAIKDAGLTPDKNDLTQLSKAVKKLSALPTQSGNAGKYLRTDGANPSWDDVDALPPQSPATVGQVLHSTAEGAMWGPSSGFTLFDFKFTDHILNDISWVNAGLFSWLSGDIYTSAYEALVAEKTAATVETEALFPWVQPVLTSNTSSSDFTIINGNATNFSSIFNSFSSTANYWTLNAGNNVSTSFYAEFAEPVKMTSFYIDGHGTNGQAYDLKNVKIYRVNSDATEELLVEQAGQGIFTINLNHVAQKIKIELKDDSGVVTASPGRIYQIKITAQKNVITYYQSENGFKICLPDQTDALENLHAETGAVWHYILDEENRRFKVPRRHQRRLIASKSGTLGYNLYSDGFCEQWGDIATSSADATNVTTFAIKYATTPKVFKNFGLNRGDPGIFYFFGAFDVTNFGFKTRYSSANDAQNQIYHAFGYADTSLLPEHFEYEYMFLGNSVQNAALVNVGTLAEQLNTKAETDLSNVSEEIIRTRAKNRVWMSGEYTPVSGTRTIVTHGLNLENPEQVQGEILLKCVVADCGYIPGEYMSNWSICADAGGTKYPQGRGVTVTKNTIETSTGHSLAGVAKSGSTAYSWPNMNSWKYVFKIIY